MTKEKDARIAELEEAVRVAVTALRGAADAVEKHEKRVAELEKQVAALRASGRNLKTVGE